MLLLPPLRKLPRNKAYMVDDKPVNPKCVKLIPAHCHGSPDFTFLLPKE